MNTDSELRTIRLARHIAEFVHLTGPDAAEAYVRHLLSHREDLNISLPEMEGFFRAVSRKAYRLSVATADQPVPAKHPPFLENALRLAAHGSVNAALDVIYDAIDSLMCDGKVEDLRSLITSVNPADVHVDLCIGMLSASIPMRDRLPERKGLYDRIAAALCEQGENPGEALLGLD